MLKKFFSVVFAVAFFVCGFAFANGEGIVVHVFTSTTCPHCAQAKSFLDDFEKENNFGLKINDYEFGENINKINEFYDAYSVPESRRGLVPAIFVGDRYWVGFNDSVAGEISSYLVEWKQNSEQNATSTENTTTTENATTSENPIASENASTSGNSAAGNNTGTGSAGNTHNSETMINLPFFGEVNLLDFSLPALAIVLGAMDGFNVCSLGALVMILGLVIVLRSRKKIFLFGGIFLLITGTVYGFLILAWHQFFVFISPYIRRMEALIGLLALAGGAYLLREFYKAWKSGPVCSSNNLMSRLSPKIEKLFVEKSGWITLSAAIALFAVIVTIVEFPCSAFLPVLFAGILAESGLSTSLSLAYMALYIIFYLIDEVIIFTIAALTLKIRIVSPRIIVFLNLAAALVFIFLGVYYLFGHSLF
ncbi:MAG: glutaredoxin domain-containing protein [Candidatus Pacebacteria bacterium]|nr:glutaredoxin domain-containing protein [Candidatus Paceibacterota bacterium]